MERNKRAILIVEDQKNWRDLFRELLESKFEVIVVDNYEDAIKTISERKLPFHVVITDIRLVDSSSRNEEGLRLVKRLSKSKDSTEFIVVTGYATIETATRAIGELRAYKYLEKYPLDGEFDPFEFQKIVSRAADSANRKRQKGISSNLDVFVLMPFAEQYRTFYEDVIKKTIEDSNLICKRADDFFRSSAIMNDIMYCINHAEIIVADFSGRSPNVFFEAGIAHALGKNVILIAQNLEDVPQMLKTIRCHIYTNDLRGAKEFTKVLKKVVAEIQGQDYAMFPKKKRHGNSIDFCLSLVPSTEEGERIYNDFVAEAVKEIGVDCIRAKEIFDPNSILDQIWERINMSRFIIADLTDRDPDVFYLAGLAFGLKKKIVLMAQRKEDIPFDLKKGSSLIYSLETYSEGKLAKDRLQKMIIELLRN